MGAPFLLTINIVLGAIVALPLNLPWEGEHRIVVINGLPDVVYLVLMHCKLSNSSYFEAVLAAVRAPQIVVVLFHSVTPYSSPSTTKVTETAMHFFFRKGN